MNNRSIATLDKNAAASKHMPSFPALKPTMAVNRESTTTSGIKAVALTLVCRGRTICENLHFGIPRGGVSVLVPRDAADKALWLNLTAGKHLPFAGKFLIDGHKAHLLQPTTRQRIGILENAERTYEVMTIGQAALFFSGCFAEWRPEVYDRLTDGFGVSRRVKISNLSNSQRALVALAMLLAKNPDFLILDDWITAFGDKTRTVVYDAIRRHSAQPGKTTLLVGHHVGLTPQRVDHLILVGHSTSLTLPTADLPGSFPSFSVTAAVQSLGARGLVTALPCSLVTLTPASEARAREALHRHESLRNFFTEVLDIDPTTSDTLAGRIKHTVGAEILENMSTYTDTVRQVRLQPSGQGKERKPAKARRKQSSSPPKRQRNRTTGRPQGVGASGQKTAVTAP